MRNYVIINGVNSLTIQGLAIKTLPPITKPIQRNLREEIDGRDGDIVTTLGYGAYDKTIEIGLFGTFDIDEVIAYFNQKGTITFSNEADKVYYFEALDQVDYAELLKFRTANVVLHCQPFKYPLNETPLVEEYEYVNGSGTNVTLDNTSEAIFNKIELQGNTFQQTYTGQNLLPNNAITKTANGITFTKNSDGSITMNGTCTGNVDLYFVGDYDNYSDFGLTTGNYNLNGCTGGSEQTYMLFAVLRRNGSLYYYSSVNASGRVMIVEAGDEFRIFIRVFNGQVLNNITIYPQINAGNTALPYIPYVGGMTSPNPLFPQPIQVVSGDNEITICGRNLFNKDTISERTYLQADGTLLTGTAVDYNTSDFIAVRPNTTYYKTETLSPRTKYYDRNKHPLNVTTYQDISIGGNAGSFTTPNNAYYLRMTINISTEQSKLDKVMLSLGSTRPTYEAYEGQSFPLYLGVENLAQITATGSYNCTLSDGVFTSISYSGYGNIRPAITQITLPANKTIYYSADIRLKSGTSSGALNNIAIFGTTNTYNTNKLVNPTISSEFQRYIFSITPTIDEPAKGLLIQTNSSSSNAVIEIKNIMISYSYSHDFYEYGQTPVEMASIPNTNYRDIFVKENGSWYKRKKINKRTLDGTESAWGRGSGATTRAVFSLNTFSDRMRSNSMEDFVSDKFSFLGNAQSTNLGYAMSFNIDANSNYLYIQVPLDVVAFGQVEDFKTWLSNHVTNVYYILEEAEDIEITNETLIDQLEAIKNAISYKGQTNISQTNNGMPFILDLLALKENSDHLVIDNIGNIYSKPTLDLEGTGIVDIYLNDTQMFEVDLSEKNEIVIDTEKMEAYNPTDNTLANRQVTGDYSKFKLDSGENDLRFSGNLTKATITRYERWL